MMSVSATGCGARPPTKPCFTASSPEPAITAKLLQHCTSTLNELTKMTMRLVIVSGRSGSGKSTALNALEDLDFYCIDNLPAGLLPELWNESINSNDPRLQKIAVSIDARNLEHGIEKFPVFYQQCLEKNIHIDILYLDATDETLLQRFNSTRRKHPLTRSGHSLKEAIKQERTLLDPIVTNANLIIDTSALTLYELRDLIKVRIAGRATQEIAILFQSFGFKNGVPNDAETE